MDENQTSTRASSLEPSGNPVKKGPLAAKQPAGRPRLARHFEGWQLGALTVGWVLTAALLAVPRAAPPGVFPVPLLDVREAAAQRARFNELSDRAERRPLPFETRAVGDGFRKLGLALAGAGEDADHQHRVVRERVGLALQAAQGPALLELRAVQARLFVTAVRAHEGSSLVSPELQALGGDFVKRAIRNGWLGPSGSGASDDELRTLFVFRWTELTGLRQQPGFAPSLGELRRYYRFLLLYPERAGATGSDLDPSETMRRRLQYVEALAKRDPDYPAALARGALLGALGMAPASVAALEAHRTRRPDGEWSLRARNYLAYALDGPAPDEFP